MKMPTVLLLLVFLLTAGAAGPDPEPAGDAEVEGVEGAGGGEAERPLETFVPSETLPADSAVAFPVDI